MHNDQRIIGRGAHMGTVRMLVLFLVPVCLGLVSVRSIRGTDDAPQPKGSEAAKTDVSKTLQEAKGSFQPILPDTVAQSKSEL